MTAAVICPAGTAPQLAGGGECGDRPGTCPCVFSLCVVLQCTAVQQAMALSCTHLCGFGLHRVSHGWEVRLSQRRTSPSMWLPWLGSSTVQGSSHLCSLAAQKRLTLAPQASFKPYKSPFPPPVGNTLQLPRYPCLKAPCPDVIHSPVLPTRRPGRAFGPHISRPSPSPAACLFGSLQIAECLKS